MLIVGAGPIGQMSVRWARAAGLASIVIADTAASRLPLAKSGGATSLIEQSITEARIAVLEAGGGTLPRIVIDSTGNATVFASALGLVRNFGRIVVLGDTGAPAKQMLTPDVILRGLTIFGAHDAQSIGECNDNTINGLFFHLASSGRFPLEGLTTHVLHRRIAWKPTPPPIGIAPQPWESSRLDGRTERTPMIQQSFSYWCVANRDYEPEPLLAGAAKIGFKAVELLDESLWPLARKAGLAIASTGAHGGDGLNREENFQRIDTEVRANLTKAREWKIPVLICFFPALAAGCPTRPAWNNARRA